MSRHDNEGTTTIDMVLLFSMPAIIAAITAFLWFGT